MRAAPGERRRRPARRRRDRPVHRPLPQGSHRRPRRRPAAHPRGAAALPARAGGPARRRCSSRSARRASSTTALEARILAADSKARLEDIYLPYKPKRRTKARSPARPGWSRWPTRCWPTRPRTRTTVAAGFVNEQVADAAAALEGARAILVERFAEDADLIGGLRERMWTRGRLVTKVREGKETDGREVLRLLRLRRGVHHAAVAPDPGRVPRREGGGPRPHPGAATPTPAEPGRGDRLRAHHRRRVRHRRPGPPGRPLAARHGALGLAHPDPAAPRHRHPGPAAQAAEDGRDPGVRRQPARPAAGRAGRQPGHHGPRPRPAHRREGRGGRRHRQGGRHRHDLPARAAPGLGRRAGHAGQAGRGARRRAGRDRQRHRVPGDRQAGRRAGRDATRRSS